MNRPLESVDDTTLLAAFARLEPSSQAFARMRHSVMTDFHAQQRSLVDEWLGLFRVRPLSHLAYACAGGITVVLGTFLGAMLPWIVRSLSRG